MKTSNFYEINPTSWEDAKRIGKKLSTPSLRFLFRGQVNKEWGLKTSMERYVEKLVKDLSWAWYFEKETITRFKSRAHQYIQSPPKDQDLIEWLSIIQHYGGPTRLLDFSESFYISSFFAIDSAQEDSSVWCINETVIINSINEAIIKKQLVSKYDHIQLAEFYLENPNDNFNCILPITPSRLNERLSVQKGRFLFPVNVLKSFEENLCATFGFPFNSLKSVNSQVLTVEEFETLINNTNLWPSIIKINCSEGWHLEAIRDLYSMNIDTASLFPGLEGFAKSLKFILLKENYRDIV